MATLATQKRRSVPLRLLAALRQAGMTEEELRRHYGLKSNEPVPDGAPEPLCVDDMELLPDDGYRYELWEGELVRMSPVMPRHGLVTGRIVRHLNVYLAQNPIGEVLVTDVGYQAGPGASLYCPDAAYLSNERAAIPLDEFVAFAPDIAIEVQSPKNTQRKLETKAAHYMQHGAKYVWSFFPKDWTVRVHRPDVPAETLHAGDLLTAEDLLPGFSARVGDLFPD